MGSNPTHPVVSYSSNNIKHTICVDKFMSILARVRDLTKE